MLAFRSVCLLPLLTSVAHGLAIRADYDFGDTFVHLSAGAGAHLKGWPEQPGPNPAYDAEWQTSRRFAMPSNRNGLSLPTIQHEGGVWALQVASLDGRATAYVSVLYPPQSDSWIMDHVGQGMNVSICDCRGSLCFCADM